MKAYEIKALGLDFKTLDKKIATKCELTQF